MICKGLRFNGKNQVEMDEFIGVKGKVDDKNGVNVYRALISARKNSKIEVIEGDYILSSSINGYFVIKCANFNACFRRIMN